MRHRSNSFKISLNLSYFDIFSYQVKAEHPTGKCAVLITGHDRSLVTKLDAANHFTVDHLESADNWAVVS
jgi:sugar/nucleoside kinase (ribokinase family)